MDELNLVSHCRNLFNAQLGPHSASMAVPGSLGQQRRAHWGSRDGRDCRGSRFGHVTAIFGFEFEFKTGAKQSSLRGPVSNFDHFWAFLEPNRVLWQPLPPQGSNEGHTEGAWVVKVVIGAVVEQWEASEVSEVGQTGQNWPAKYSLHCRNQPSSPDFDQFQAPNSEKFIQAGLPKPWGTYSQWDRVIRVPDDARRG